MENLVNLFIQESINMELNIGDLYQLFSVKYPADYDFWWRLSMEEINHGALIESINDAFIDETLLPLAAIERQTDELKRMNQLIQDQIQQYKSAPPSRLESFEIAINLENSIGEFHFELFMTEKSGSQMIEIFQKLNGDDKNHANRISNYSRSIPGA